MSHFRNLLIAMTGLMVVVTLFAVAKDGPNLLPHFIDPILALSWQGQFNIDFATYLILTGVWLAWRGGFTTRSVAFGILAPPMGMLFFAPYLIYLISKTGGDPREFLLGVHAK